jgi:hypothetical protein
MAMVLYAKGVLAFTTQIFFTLRIAGTLGDGSTWLFDLGVASLIGVFWPISVPLCDVNVAYALGGDVNQIDYIRYLIKNLAILTAVLFLFFYKREI